MILSADNLVHYLLARGFMTYESVVDGDLMILETTRRNRNFKVIRRDSPGYFVKQVVEWDPQAINTLQREATCYQLAQNTPELSALSALFPKCHGYDVARHILVLELIKDGESLGDYYRRTGNFAPSVAEHLARVIGTYHKGDANELQKHSNGSVFPKMVPWILSVHQQQPSWFSSLSGANSQLLQIVARYPDFPERLDALRARWTVRALIHGDMKWENCLLHDFDGIVPRKVKIVDWELADLGDPLWDVGAVLQSYLCYWIMSLPSIEGTSIEQIITRAPISLERMQPSVQTFWNTYAKVLEYSREQSRDALIRCITYGAARMIQTTYEYMTYAPELNTNALYLLQVSMNVLRDPDEAILQLLGITNA